jgi:eukaryotic-like serine/threonine-protein kinase
MDRCCLDQLHRSGVSHQDVKPSNVIAMEALSGALTVDMKLGDLGRVIRKDVAGPFDAALWPGDGHYMPPERWYRYRPPEWPDEREASDAFMLGSLMFFMFAGVPIQPLLVSKLPSSHLPSNWRGGFDDNLKVVLQDAQARVIADHLAPVLADDVRDGVVELAKQLTEPDPMLRGDPRARRSVGRPVGMDRIHQRLRALALRAAIRERVKKP